MLKKILFAVSLGLVLGTAAPAQVSSSYDRRLAGSPIYSDPGFQEFVETSYGYMNPRNMARAAVRFRDAVAAPAAAPRKAAVAKPGKYVFVSIQPKARDYSGLLGELSASAGFVLSGERIVHLKNSKKVRIVGWVRASALASIRKNPGVASVYRVRKATTTAL